MINSDETNLLESEPVEKIVADGPRGALTLAAIATFIVVMCWVLFYLLVFVPRGA
jgi:hypothetical protein